MGARIVGSLPRFLFVLVLTALSSAGSAQSPTVPRWGLFEASFTATEQYENPLQDVDLFVTFTSPSRQTRTVRGFLGWRQSVACSLLAR